MKRTPRRAPRPWEAPTPGGSARTTSAAPQTPTATARRAPVAGSQTFPRRTPGGPRGTRGLCQPDGRWLCDCVPRRPAVQRQTRKPGPNQGRWFWTCAQTDRRRQCDFFSWDDSEDRSGPSTIHMRIGRRTTPEPERQRPEPTTPTPVRRRAPSGDSAPLSAAARRQRIFTTPTTLSSQAPPLSTPTRRSRRLASAADSLVDEAPPTPSLRRQRVRPITEYFRKDGQPTLPVAGSPEPPSSARPPSPSYSEDFDSETERALLALAEHAERKSRQEEEEEEEELKPKAEPELEPEPTNRSGIVVPTHPPPLSPSTPSRLRRGRDLLLAREDRTASQSSQMALSAPTATATPPSSQMSGVSVGIKREAEDDDVFQTPQRPLRTAVTPPSSKKRRTTAGAVGSEHDCTRTTDALRLLDGQPVSAAVREQLRELLNREFGQRVESAEER